MSDPVSRLATAVADRYSIQRELGTGGMATVYLATDLKHNRRLALKVMRPELAALLGPDRFLREIATVAQLSHPHILPLFDSGEASGLLYYVMPFVEGESLREKIRREWQLALKEAVRLAQQIAAALDYAHRRGVIHRDIKPENILLHEGEALIADFGIALAVREAGGDRLTQTGFSVGTPEYMSPEQAAGSRTVDARTDIYSLGCVLYEMLAGEPPYTGSSAQAVIAKRLVDPVLSVQRLRGGVPASIEAVLNRALAKVPADRFDTAAAFAEALTQPGAPRLPRQSIAVLPFANMSPDPENEYFSDGITDDLIAQVAKIRGLKVISRTSVMRYKTTDKSARQIASELGVATILEGSVRRAGNRVRVVAQLIAADTDEHLWADTYDRDLHDVFAVQSDVALNIARALETSLTAADRQELAKKPVDPAAYDLYLLGRHHWNKRTDESIRKAIRYFDDARARDPSYAGAYAGLADSYLFAGLGYAAIPRAEAFAKGKAAAARAVELDASLPEALCAQGFLRLVADWDIAGARQILERAVALNPNHAAAHQWLGWCYDTSGEYLAGIRSRERALELDPLSVVLVTESGWTYTYLGLHDHALERYRRALELDPNFALAHYNVAACHEAGGRYQDAIAEYETAIALSGGAPWYTAFLAAVFARVENRAKAEELLAGLVQLATTRHDSSLCVAIVEEALGNADVALDWLDRAYTEHEPFLITLGAEGWLTFKSIREHPRFKQLLKRLGIKPHDIAGQRAQVSAAHGARA